MLHSCACCMLEWKHSSAHLIIDCRSYISCVLFMLIIQVCVYLGGDLRLHDQNNRSPRDWATMQTHSESRLATLSLIESFRQIAMKNNELNVVDSGVAELNNTSTPRAHRAALKFPKLRNRLAAMGLVCSENCEFIGPLGNVQGTGFGKVSFSYPFKSRSIELLSIHYSVLDSLRAWRECSCTLACTVN